MATNLSRLFSSTITKTDFSVPASHRLICSTSQLLHTQQQETKNPPSPDTKEKIEIRTEDESKHEEKDADIDGYVNKETGEVGGPRGPEPTRYGDWEKGGRCCDF